MAKAQTDFGYNSSATFKLRFNAGTQIHGATAPFLYSQDLSRPDANNQTIADIITSYWISFVLYNDPNPLRAPNAPFWPSYRGDPEGPVAFNELAITYTDIFVETDLQNSPACDFFNAEGYLSFGMY